jgi:hypothetical protein
MADQSQAAPDARTQTDPLTDHDRRRTRIRRELRRGHYELTVDVPTHDRVRAAFTEFAACL